MDTGAGDKFCSTDVWSELGKPLLYPVTGRYDAANRQPLPTFGRFKMVVSLHGKDRSQGKSVDFIVTKVPQLNLLGRKAIIRLCVNAMVLLGLPVEKQ